MKTTTPLVIVGLCGFLASSAWSAESSAKSAPPARTSETPPAAVAPSPRSSAESKESVAEKKPAAAAQPVAPAKLPPELAASKVVEAANEEHIEQGRDRFAMETPPPPIRAEKKPPIPASGMVWVPGHWVPVKGEWQWRSGEWGVPATPISVWIDAKYDSKAKQWSPGYWQPDRPAPHQPEPVEKETTPTAKFF